MNTEEGNTYPLIFLGLQRWDEVLASTPFLLASAVSKTQRVFFIDHPFTWKEFFQHFFSQKLTYRKAALLLGKKRYYQPNPNNPNLTLVIPRLTIPINWLPHGKLYRWLLRINNGIFNRAFRKILKDHDIRDFVFINGFDPYFGIHLSQNVRPLLKIYYTIDDIRHAPYLQKHGPQLEEIQFQQADLVLATSSELVKIYQEYTSNIHLLPNAVDMSLVIQMNRQDVAVPPELHALTGPLMVYTGAIGLRVDASLLKQLAIANPDKHLIMVGPVAADFPRELFDECANVLWVGARPQTALVGYVQAADCLLIPFRKTKLTQSIYPLKINEYLSSGKPIVSTDFSADILTFSPYIYVARDQAQFLFQVGKALEERDPQLSRDRKECARQNTWDARALQLRALLSEYGIKNP